MKIYAIFLFINYEFFFLKTMKFCLLLNVTGGYNGSKQTKVKYVRNIFVQSPSKASRVNFTKEKSKNIFTNTQILEFGDTH